MVWEFQKQSTSQKQANILSILLYLSLFWKQCILLWGPVLRSKFQQMSCCNGWARLGFGIFAIHFLEAWRLELWSCVVVPLCLWESALELSINLRGWCSRWYTRYLHSLPLSLWWHANNKQGWWEDQVLRFTHFWCSKSRLNEVVTSLIKCTCYTGKIWGQIMVI